MCSSSSTRTSRCTATPSPGFAAPSKTTRASRRSSVPTTTIPAPSGIVSDFRNLLHHHVHQEGAGAATTFWAGLGAIRRDVFLALGGFDEERFPKPSVEDIELGMRLHAQGGRIVLDPAIQGKHLKDWTLASMTKTDLLRRGVPWLRLVFENHPGSTALNLGWRHRIGTGASLVLLVGLVRRNPLLVGSTLAFLIALDRRFYLLLLRRRGARAMAVGVPLHVVHRLTSAAAVPIAVTSHLFGTSGAHRARETGPAHALRGPRLDESRRRRRLGHAHEQPEGQAVRERSPQERLVEPRGLERAPLAIAAETECASSVASLLS